MSESGIGGEPIAEPPVHAPIERDPRPVPQSEDLVEPELEPEEALIEPELEPERPKLIINKPNPQLSRPKLIIKK